MAISNAQLKAALKKHAAVFLLAAQELGTSRQNVGQRVSRSKDLQAWVQQIEDEIGDAAEAVIKEALLSKDKKAARDMARWYARHKLKGRGYTTRQELTGPDGAALPAQQVHVIVEYVDAPEVEDEEIPV